MAARFEFTAEGISAVILELPDGFYGLHSSKDSGPRAPDEDRSVLLNAQKLTKNCIICSRISCAPILVVKADHAGIIH